MVKRFRKRPLPEHDPPEESLLLDHAASPRDSEVPSSTSPSSFVLIGNHETFCLPSPKFAVRPRVGLLQDNSGPVFRRELAPNRLDLGVTGPLFLATHCPFLSLRFEAFLSVVSRPSRCLCQSMVQPGTMQFGPLLLLRLLLRTRLLLRCTCLLVRLLLRGFLFLHVLFLRLR